VSRLSFWMALCGPLVESAFWWIEHFCGSSARSRAGLMVYDVMWRFALALRFLKQ